MFVVAAAERLPRELAGRADEVIVLFPWGSLLRGALALPDAKGSATGIVGLVRPGGRVRILLSIDPRDGLPIEVLTVADGPRIAARWATLGLEMGTFGAASTDEIRGTGSSWARRLAAGRERDVWRIELCRLPAPWDPRSGESRERRRSESALLPARARIR
jgi:16S rRNA (adenine(1408)-N(1))-methyltransferase